MKLTKKLWHFFSNMGFMGKYSWDLAKSKYFFMITQAVLSTVQPFALLIIPKYILDELAGARRADVTLRYIGIYAAVIAFFNIASLLLTRYGSIQTIKIEHRDQMLKQKKWLHMDYGNFENGQVREPCRTFLRSDKRNRLCGEYRTRLCHKFRTALRIYLHNYVAASGDYPFYSRGDRT